MIVRKANIDEAQSIRALEELVWKESVTTKWDVASFVRYGYAYVALEKEVLCGALTAIAQRGNGVYVIDLVVHPKRRREGIAKKLYRALMREAGSAKIQTHVSPEYEASVRLHETLGFQKLKLEKNVYGLEKDGPRLLFELRM